jgi:hypothetical protein
MNETIYPDNRTDVPWPTSGSRLQAADTSTLPGSEQTTPPAVGLLKTAVQGAHATIDRLADTAAPAVRKLGDGVTAAETALHEKGARLRVKRDEWTDGVRTTVRANPLTSVAAALAFGIVIARITR